MFLILHYINVAAVVDLWYNYLYILGLQVSRLDDVDIYSVVTRLHLGYGGGGRDTQKEKTDHIKVEGWTKETWCLWSGRYVVVRKEAGLVMEFIKAYHAERGRLKVYVAGDKRGR